MEEWAVIQADEGPRPMTVTDSRSREEAGSGRVR